MLPNLQCSLIYPSQKEGRTGDLQQTLFGEFCSQNIGLAPLHISTHSPNPVSGFFLSELFAIKFLPTFLFGLWWRRDPGQITAQPPPVKRSRGKCTALRIVFGFKWYWSNNLIFKVGAIDLKVQIPAEYFSRSGTPWFMVSLQGWRRFRDHGKRGECHPSTRIINLISKLNGDDNCWLDSEAFITKGEGPRQVIQIQKS